MEQRSPPRTPWPAPRSGCSAAAAAMPAGCTPAGGQSPRCSPRRLRDLVLERLLAASRTGVLLVLRLVLAERRMFRRSCACAWTAARARCCAPASSATPRPTPAAVHLRRHHLRREVGAAAAHAAGLHLLHERLPLRRRAACVACARRLHHRAVGTRQPPWATPRRRLLRRAAGTAASCSRTAGRAHQQSAWRLVHHRSRSPPCRSGAAVLERSRRGRRCPRDAVVRICLAPRTCSSAPREPRMPACPASSWALVVLVSHRSSSHQNTTL